MLTPALPCTIAAALALLTPTTLASRAPAQDVWTVDVAGHGQFAEIQPAIDAAAPGDTILVRGPADPIHLFDGFTISKPLTLVGLSTTRIFTREVTIQNVTSGFVLLSNFGVRWSIPFAGPNEQPLYGPGVRVEGCDAVVWFQSCSVRGGFVPGGPGALIGSSSVIFAGCELMGGREGTTPTGHSHGAHGVVAQASRVAFYDTDVVGGGGDYLEGFSDIIAGNGGDGVRAGASSVIWSLASTIQGGTGGSAVTIPGIATATGGDGGTALSASSDSITFVRATDLVPGPSGHGTSADGSDGLDSFGPVTHVSGAALPLHAPDWMRDADTTTIATRGEPGVAASLLVADAPEWILLGVNGALHARPTSLAGVVSLGVIPGSGALEGTFMPARLDPGEIAPVFLQPLFNDPGGRTVGAPRAVVVLDEGFLPSDPPPIFVDVDAPAGGDGTSWLSPFKGLGRALEAVPGVGPTPSAPPIEVEVWVRKGTHRPNGPGGNRLKAFQVKSGTRLYGGFDGTETSLGERDSAAHPTVLSGDLSGDDGPGFQNIDDNAERVVSIGDFVRASRVRIDGFTIRGGHSTSFIDYNGAAINAFGELELVDCTLIDNFGSSAVFVQEPSFTALSCRFLGNDANTFPGAAARIGFFATEGEATLVNCEFAGNSGGRGGALYVEAATTVTGSTFRGNHGVFEGGAIAVSGPAPSLTVRNSVFWDNTATEPGSDDFDFANPFTLSLTVDHSLFTGGPGSGYGVGNVGGPPLFVDADGADGAAGTLDDDLQLGPGSPAVDAGQNTGVPPDTFDLDGDGDVIELLPFDLFRRPRFVDDPAAADTGDGAAPLVDMGANERSP